MALKPDDVDEAIDASRTTKPQRIADGRSLYLYVKNGRGFWVHQSTVFGPTKKNPVAHYHTRNKSLGPACGKPRAGDLTPAQARKVRDKLVVDRRDGREVSTGTRRARGEAFGTAATAWLENHSDEWGPRTRLDNQALFANYIPAAFNAKSVTEIKPEDVADLLRPIWRGPGTTNGSRLRRMVEGVLTAKSVHPNPAAWDGPLCELLSKKRATVTHREAMPFDQVPAFFAALPDTQESRIGKLVILAAVRRLEALGARWGEFDLAERVWTIPAERTKMRRPHLVPLTDAMLACLGTPGAADALVFPSARTGGLLGHKTLEPKAWCAPFTLHGFRSSFATWAEEQEEGRAFAPAVIEAALAHVKGNAVEASYRRSDLFAARRKLMEAWSKFATGL